MLGLYSDCTLNSEETKSMKISNFIFSNCVLLLVCLKYRSKEVISTKKAFGAICFGSSCILTGLLSSISDFFLGFTVLSYRYHICCHVYSIVILCMPCT